MDIAVVVLIIVIICFYASGRKTNPKKHTKQQQNSKSTRKEMEYLPFLQERWGNISEQQVNSTSKSIPSWFYDDATERQLNYLSELGVSISGGEPTKGQASDLIGLFHEADQPDRDVLKFFGKANEAANQSVARILAADQLQDPTNLEVWEARPADAIEKEFLRFFSHKIPKGLTSKEAQEIQSTIMETAKDTQVDLWCEFESIWEELSDPETRADYHIKKPSLTKYRNTWSELEKEVSDNNDIDLDTICEKLFELYPELEKQS